MINKRVQRCRPLVAESIVMIAAMIIVMASRTFADDLIGHWPLKDDARDHSTAARTVVVHGDLQFEDFQGVRSATFNGRDRWIEVPAENAPKLGTSDFTISLRLNIPNSLDDVPGDLISQYDPITRRGFHLSLKTNPVTTSLANDRSLTFGMDDNRTSEWADHGRPGHALLAFALAQHEGLLYAGTCEPGEGQAGHVYQWDQEGHSAKPGLWLDCGSPDQSNSVTALATFNGSLYAGTGKYRVAGSSLPESPNTILGGRVFRFERPNNWIDCGQLPGAEAVGGMIVFHNQLYASSLYKPAGFFRYDGDKGWIDCGTPGGKRVVALGIFNGYLWATSYDGGFVYRYDGKSWTDCGQLGENTQTYSFAVYQGRLYVGTWPSGRVYRFEDVNLWTDVGRLGEELEVMGMLVHNGRLIAGTLPLADVHSFDHANDGSPKWNKLTQLDHTPDVKYRRAWTMAEHNGRVLVSTLPSGKIFSWSAGHSVSAVKPLSAGWHYIAASREAAKLRLFVDGQCVNEADFSGSAPLDLTSATSLNIGFGQNDRLNGRAADVRIFSRSLSTAEIKDFMSERH